MQRDCFRLSRSVLIEINAEDSGRLVHNNLKVEWTIDLRFATSLNSIKELVFSEKEFREQVFSDNPEISTRLFELALSDGVIVPSDMDESSSIGKRQYPQVTSTGLINHQVSAPFLKTDGYAGSHGADKHGYLGAGLLYYSLVYMMGSEVAVCLGSGDGFVPSLVRQAQRDLGINGTTYLVDANLTEKGWGDPAQWMGQDSDFRQRFPDIKVIIDSTANAAKSFFQPNGIQIDYLHIDADHSYPGVSLDLKTYRPLLRPNAVVTLHDTSTYRAGVHQLVDELRNDSEFQLMNFPDVGWGSAILRYVKIPFYWKS